MNAVSGHNSSLLHVWDTHNKVKWLVDSGSLLTIIPPSVEHRAKGPDENTLCAANGTKIACYGKASVHIVIGSRSFFYDAVVADVKHHILGADFLSHFYLAPNLRDGNLLDLKELSTLPAKLATGFKSNPINLINKSDSPYHKLLDRFPAISQPSFKIKNPKHGVKHSIPTSGRPVFSRSRPLPSDRLAIAKEEIGKLVKLGVCRRAKSAWSSPLIVAPKPGGGWRVCGDYRRLNNMTEMDRYPVRTLKDFTAELHGKRVFSKVDLLKGFHQIPMEEEDIAKTGVITPFGLFEFLRCPFGLKNAPQDFQRLMDELLGEIPHVFVYLDDILIASVDEQQHLKDLEEVFRILDENGLTINRDKCELGKPSLDFLGYRVDATGITPLPERVAAINKVPPPTTIKELQSFLGMVNYYRRFIPHAAEHLFHLFGCLKGRSTNKKHRKHQVKLPKTLNWTQECQASFDAIKSALASATLLHHPIPGAHLALTTDASKLAMGGVLEQRGANGWEPLGFWSAKLQPHQQLWPPYDRELLAAFRGIRHFRPMVEGRPFTLYSDHLPLVPSMSKKTDAQTARQVYQLSVVSEFTTDIRYIEGKSNVVADALSRPPVEQLQPDVNSISTLSSKASSSRVAAAPPQRLPGSTGETTSTASSTASSACPQRLPGSTGEITSTTSSTASSALPQRLPGSTGDFSTLHSASSVSSGQPPSLPQHLDPLEWPELKHPSRRQQEASTLSSLLDSAAAASSAPINSNSSQTASTPSSPSAAASSTTSSSPGPPETASDEDFEAFVGAIEAQSLDLTQMAREQPLDRDCQEALQNPQSNFRVKTVDLGSAKLLVDTSTGKPRPLVPYSWRKKVFDAVHGLGHPGVERTRQAITNRFVWPNVRHDASKWARECLPCQRSKVIRHTVPPIGEFIVPQKRFEHLNVDLVTLPLSNGFKHLLTIVDRLSRWPQAIPLTDMTTESVADAFAHGWVSTFGVPATITTDRGAQFGTAIWTQLMQTWGIRSTTTTAYHPEANGMVERFHRRLKEALLALGADAGQNWYWRLPLVLLAIRTTIKPDVGATPSDMVFGEGVAVPGCLLSSTPSSEEELQQHGQRTLANLRMEVERLQPTPTSTHRIQRVQLPSDLRTASHVFIKRGGVTGTLSTPYTGPFRVVERQPTYFKISIPRRGIESVALARIKPACVAPLDDEDPAPPPVTPPRPGRPPGVRTRHPAPTDRVTRQSRQQEAEAPPTADADAPTPSSDPVDAAPLSPIPASPTTPDEFDDALPPPPPRPRTPTREPQRQPRFFLDPSRRRFSARPPKTSYAAPLEAILKSHLKDLSDN